VQTLNAEELEPISNTTFSQLIQESFSQGKGFIIGRMQTRDRVNFQKSFYHCFYAPNLVKLLFKTPMLFGIQNNEATQPEEPLISRYHTSMPLTVRNPLNNEIIVGEVQFFLMKPEEGLNSAKFIGTDFNYA
jgi:Domain of unknown function (DUF5092)